MLRVQSTAAAAPDGLALIGAKFHAPFLKYDIRKRLRLASADEGSLDSLDLYAIRWPHNSLSFSAATYYKCVGRSLTVKWNTSGLA